MALRNGSRFAREHGGCLPGRVLPGAGLDHRGAGLRREDQDPPPGGRQADGQAGVSVPGGRPGPGPGGPVPRDGGQDPGRPEPVPPTWAPFEAVEFDGLVVTPYVTDRGRIAYSLRATGIKAARPVAQPRTRPDARQARHHRDGPGRRPVGVASSVLSGPHAAADDHGGPAGLLVTLTLPEHLDAGHVRFARDLAARAAAVRVEVERSWRGLPRCLPARQLGRGRPRLVWQHRPGPPSSLPEHHSRKDTPIMTAESYPATC